MTKTAIPAPAMPTRAAVQTVEPGFAANPLAPGMAEVLRWFSREQLNPLIDVRTPPMAPINDATGIPLHQRVQLQFPGLMRAMPLDSELTPETRRSSRGFGLVPPAEAAVPRPAKKVDTL